MILGVPREIKEAEHRVSMTPYSIREYVAHGHHVLVEKGAGIGSSISDNEYLEAGAELVASAEDIWKRSEMVIKVKEPVESEFPLMREGQIVFTFFHLAAEHTLTLALVEKKVTAIAYETVQLADGSLPILKSMSEIAGKLAVQFGAQALEAINGGRGVLLGGADGIDPALVVILGGGTAGWHACSIALGMGARVCLLDINLDVLKKAKKFFGKNIDTVYADQHTIEDFSIKADLLIGTVLIAGAKAPRLVSRQTVKKMKKGAAIVDVSIDQGGCIETSRPTTHLHPFFEEEGIIHCCITNFPGIVPLTSTHSLSMASLPFGLELANKGVLRAIHENPALRKGLNTFQGMITCPQVAKAFGMKYSDI